MRAALSEGLVDLARNDQRTILLTGDHGYSLFDHFRSLFPRRFINAGIAEQNMVGMAAGLSKIGFLPIVYGLSSFVPIRVLEQIKLDVCRDSLPVIFLGDGAGLVYSTLGVSHQSTEDIAALRAIPNLSIFSPADRFEMRYVINLASKLPSPSYIRIGKGDIGDVHSQPLGSQDKSTILSLINGSSDLVFLATGSMVKPACLLSNYFPGSSVFSVPILKPFCGASFAEAVRDKKIVVTMEEHSIYGGLGGIVSEIAAENYSIKVLRIGIEDKFSSLCGTYDYLLKEHKLDLLSIKDKILEYIDRFES